MFKEILKRNKNGRKFEKKRQEKYTKTNTHRNLVDVVFATGSRQTIVLSWERKDLRRYFANFELDLLRGNGDVMSFQILSRSSAFQAHAFVP